MMHKFVVLYLKPAPIEYIKTTTFTKNIDEDPLMNGRKRHQRTITTICDDNGSMIFMVMEQEE